MFICYCILKFTIGSTTFESKIKAGLILPFQIGEQEIKTMDPFLQRVLTSCQLLQNKFW